MFTELRRDLTLEQYYNFVYSLESLHPDKLSIANITPRKKLPVLSITATSGTGNKQRILLTAMHSGVEFSSSNTLFRLLKWLVSDNSDAEKALALCEITIIPIPNPHGYKLGKFNGQFHTELGGDPYSGNWTVAGVSDNETNWEAFAVQKVIDALKPELYIDCHGVSYKGQTMIENTGVSVHGMNRPHHTAFADKINYAAKVLGYHCEQFELRQKSLPVVPELADRRYQTCSPAVTSCTYAYHNYHTLAMTMEIGHEESGLARLKMALSLADFHWEGERSPGYPVNRLYGEGHFGLHPFSESYPEKRKERCNLWQSVNDYATASIQPQYPGSEGFLVFVPKVAELLKKSIATPLLIQDTIGIIDTSSLSNYMKTVFKGRWLGLSLPDSPKLPKGPVTISIKIPFSDSTVGAVWINSRPTDNYNCIDYDAFSMIFVNFPEGIVDTTLIDIKYDYSIG